MTEIRDETQLREMLGEPTELVRKKIADRLNSLTRQFVERSPFVVVATGRPDGGLDVSPRGDPAGFVRILDERTLLLPDRPGNKLADTLTNLLGDDRIALLFLIPGVNDTFRVNGRARIVDDPELLADTLTNLLGDGRIALLFLIPGVNDSFRVNGRARIVDDPKLLADSEVEGKVPQLGILVEVEEAYTQCPKALLRSELWNPERHIDRSELPASGEIMRAIADPELDVDVYEEERADRYRRREGFY